MKTNQWMIFVSMILALSQTACLFNSQLQVDGLNGPSTIACGSTALFDQSPIAPNGFTGLVPMGHVNPAGNVFPSDHIYFYLPPNSVQDVFSPGYAVTFDVSVLNGTDYTIRFSPCNEAMAYLGHLTSVSQKLIDQMKLVNPNCYTYSNGGGNYQYCSYPVRIELFSGEWIGTTGQASMAAFSLDFGMIDSRVSSLAFANPSMYFPQSNGMDRLHAVCPVDYFSASVKATLQARFSDWTGTMLRTQAPFCGEAMQDVIGTAHGNWYVSGAMPGQPEDMNIAFVNDDDFQSARQAFSVGSNMAASALPAGAYYFSPIATGLVNRPFESVAADGNIYCYENFQDGSGMTVLGGGVILLQMTDSATIRVEHVSGTCATVPMSFSANASMFYR